MPVPTYDQFIEPLLPSGAQPISPPENAIDPATLAMAA
jgi:hypothetical protein